MANTVVVGAQWGDEAKGKVVDYLAGDADLVIRYNGGSNAGHTVVIGSDTFKFHLVPCGILRPKVISVIADGVVIDPQVLVGEIGGLTQRGVSVDNLRVSANAHVIMPYHLLLDRLEEESKGAKKIGTTVRGIGPVYADKASRIGIRVGELIDPQRFAGHLSENLKVKNRLLTQVYGADPLSEKAILDEYSAHADLIRPFVTNTNYLVNRAASEGLNLLFEGAQGALLDIDHGTYPCVTSSHSVAGGACIGTGVGPRVIDGIIGVAKAYSTRVGSGVFPTELLDSIGDCIRERGREYGTTTGRPRRCGWLDTVALRFSAMVNGLTGLAVTLLDVLSGIETVKVCTAYRCDGSETAELPGDWEAVKECVPIYDELPGWSDEITEVRRYEDLPAKTREYLEHVEGLAGVPIQLVSVGPRRDQTIVRNP